MANNWGGQRPTLRGGVGGENGKQTWLDHVKTMDFIKTSYILLDFPWNANRKQTNQTHGLLKPPQGISPIQQIFEI